LEAGFDPQHIHFHGNNKTKHELQYALESKVGYIVIDALEEIELIDKYASETVNVVLRLNPGVEAHTHEFIQTGQDDSNFGLSIKHGLANQAVEKVENTKPSDTKGDHGDVGSQ